MSLILAHNDSPFMEHIFRSISVNIYLINLHKKSKSSTTPQLSFFLNK